MSGTSESVARTTEHDRPGVEGGTAATLGHAAPAFVEPGSPTTPPPLAASPLAASPLPAPATDGLHAVDTVSTETLNAAGAVNADLLNAGVANAGAVSPVNPASAAAETRASATALETAPAVAASAVAVATGAAPALPTAALRTPVDGPSGGTPALERPAAFPGDATDQPAGPVHRAAFAAAPLALAVVDSEGTVIEANDAFRSLFESEDHTPTGRPAAELLDLAGDTRTWHAFREVLRGTSSRLRCTRLLRHPDGQSLWAQVAVSPLTGKDRGAALVSVTDISARRDLQARLRHLQMHDPVTRLPNRTLFFERVSTALESAAGEGSGTGRIGLCYLDIDGFKAVNDTLGHRTGDRLLAAVAERLTRCAEKSVSPRGRSPLVARLGGDEFAVLVEGSTGTDQLAELAESLLGALEQPFDLGERRPLAVSASIGVVERPAAGTTATALMQAADTTLYWAKADGRARWTLFDPERNAHRMTRQTLSSTLRQAVEREEFVLEYQPLVHMDDGTVRGVEALVRWEHPHFGLLGPNRFIPLAEEDGSIVPLGRWVLRTACLQARRWQLQHAENATSADTANGAVTEGGSGAGPVYVSVNVAVRQVWDSDLVADVTEVLEETGLPPHLLQLELTESAVMGSTGRPLEVLRELSELGVRIAIDDFGTGYSNLAYLSRLPVSVLKLDGSFVSGFRQDSEGRGTPADEVVVEAMVQLAHKLGLTVTAECVETDGQADRLRRIGCDTGQGWLYSRPVAPESITRMLLAAAGRR